MLRKYTAERVRFNSASADDSGTGKHALNWLVCASPSGQIRSCAGTLIALWLSGYSELVILQEKAPCTLLIVFLTGKLRQE